MITFRAGAAYLENEPNNLIVSDTMLRRLGNTNPDSVVGQDIEIRTLTFDFNLTGIIRMMLNPNTLPFSHQTYAFTICGVAERMGFGGPMPVRPGCPMPGPRPPGPGPNGGPAMSPTRSRT